MKALTIRMGPQQAQGGKTHEKQRLVAWLDVCFSYAFICGYHHRYDFGEL
jgi:hypothetical protein